MSIATVPYLNATTGGEKPNAWHLNCLAVVALIRAFGASFARSDQWGVMHNGKTAYPGAVECIDRLVEAGKKIVS